MSPEKDIDEGEQRTLIERACATHDLKIQGWSLDSEDDRLKASLGRWSVAEDNEEKGLYSGAEGELYATVVGAPQYGNVHVAYYFLEDGMDVATGKVEPWDEVEPAV